MSAQPVAEILGAGDEAIWDAIADDAIGGGPYHLSAYLKALANASGDEVGLLGVSDPAGDLIGGVPLYEHRERGERILRGRYLLYYNGPIAARLAGAGATRVEKRIAQVVAAVRDWLVRQDYDRVILKSRGGMQDFRELPRSRWTLSPVYTYVVPLAGEADMLAAIDRNVRRLVKRCEAHGWTLRQTSSTDRFLDLHTQSQRRIGLPPYLPVQNFARFLETLIEAGIARLFEAVDADGRTGAAQVVIASKHPVTHTVAAAGTRDAAKAGANAFLRFKVFRTLAEEGYLANDLTDAHQPAVARFKSQLGGQLRANLELERRPSARARLNLAMDAGVASAKGALRAVLGRGRKT